MRTTLDLPDELFRQAKAKAALEGTSLKELVTGFIAAGLRQASHPASGPRQRSRLPVIRKRGQHVVPNLTPELQANLESEEDLAKLNRSFGR